MNKCNWCDKDIIYQEPSICDDCYKKIIYWKYEGEEDGK